MDLIPKRKEIQIQKISEIYLLRKFIDKVVNEWGKVIDIQTIFVSFFSFLLYYHHDIKKSNIDAGLNNIINDLQSLCSF